MTCAIALRIPFPHACNILLHIKIGKLGAIMESSNPKINNRIALRYSLRVGNRLIKNAVSGMIIPMAREYPLVSHCPVVTLILKSCIILGSAVVNAVASIDEAMQVIMILIKIKVRLFFVTVTELLIAILTFLMFHHKIYHFTLKFYI